MPPSSIDAQAFALKEKGSSTKIAAAIGYDAATDAATLDPTNSLRSRVTCKAVVSTGAKDLAGNSFAQQYRRFFMVCQLNAAC
jgi:Bacterial Ig-like domain